MAVIHVARQRWRAARQSWAEAHGMDWRKLPSAVGPVVDRPYRYADWDQARQG